MINALWTAASGMRGQQFNIDTIANNLANVNTTGYKKTRVDFQDLLYQTIRVPGARISADARIPTGLQIGHGVRPAATQKIFTMGNVIETQNKLDMQLDNPTNFFEVLDAEGNSIYTRDGSFKMDDQGRVVTSDGFVLQPEIILPPDMVELYIGTDGTVSVRRAGEEELTELAQIQIVRFANPAGLESIGRNFFRATTASGAPERGIPSEDGFGMITSGFLEISNVEVVEEMVRMITAQRAYEANSRAIMASDDMLATANQIRR